MDEDLATSIIAEVLERKWGLRISPRASGPDFLHSGKAVEVKGSDIRFYEHAAQLSRYAYEYHDFTLAFPHDMLNTANLMELHAFASIMFAAFKKHLSLILIAEQKEHFQVAELDDARELLPKIFQAVNTLDLWRQTEPKFVGNLIEGYIKSLTRQLSDAAEKIVVSPSGFGISQSYYVPKSSPSEEGK